MDPLDPVITALHAESRLRVWSLVITVFGDCVQHRGGAMSTARLGRLLGRIGVEQGALRTALSRLGRDGWVDSARSGRLSYYRLSASGLTRFTEATSRIYAAPQTVPVTDWAVSTQGTAQTALPLGGLWLSPAGATHGAPHGATHGATHSATHSGAPAFRLTGQITDLSDAMRDSLISGEHAAALQRLHADLDHLGQLDSDPLTHAAARILLIHRWRRIVLRYPELPCALLPVALAAVDPRARVAAAYQHLTPGAEAWLDSAPDDLAPMPAADSGFARRFCPPHPA